MGSSRHLARISSTRWKSCDLVTSDLDVLHGSACRSAEIAASMQDHYRQEDHRGHNARSSANHHHRSQPHG
jgi:hypothetical protein